MSRRTERISEQLRSEIARVLSVEATDPRIRLVTLTRVDVAPDLSRAVVFWSAMETGDDKTIEQVGDGLRSAASFVRRRLAQVVPLRRIPELHFRFDPALVEGDKMLALLSQISSDRESSDRGSLDGGSLDRGDVESASESDSVTSEESATANVEPVEPVESLEGTNGEST